MKKEEKILFRKWVRSDFVNKNEEVIKLFEYLDSRKEIKESIVRKQKVFEIIYPNLEYDDSKMRHLMSFTTEVLESFFSYFYNYQKTYTSKLQLIKYYSRNKFNKYFLEEIKDLQKILNNAPKKDIEYYHTIYELELEKNRVINTDTRNNEDNFGHLFDALHIYSMVEVLRNACNALPYKDMKNLQYDIPLLDPILGILKSGKFEEINILQIYYLLFVTLSENSEAYFDKLIAVIKKSEAEFSIEELKDIYLLCINFCIKKYNNENKLNFAEYAYDLYIASIENGCLLENDELSRFSFSNIVAFGLKIHSTKTVEKFIEQYKNLLSINYRDNTVDYNLSKIYYVKEQYKLAMSLLMTTEFKDTMWNINAKYLLLKILYQTNELETLDTFLSTFNVFIHRQKEIGYHKEYFRNIIKQFNFLNRMTKLPKRTRLPKIIAFLEKEQVLDNEWFNAQFEKLMA